MQELVLALMSDPESIVKRAIVPAMPELCLLFNSSFFEAITGLATFVGGKNMEHYILPLILQALAGNFRFMTC
jgi:phosphoinositide-3-kinase regulatory subunit 4